ncbi:hypothetical protein GGI03_004014 [Coemansia sp. RSA 2337]|nr:hypothetical protein H4S04_007119 [Coemansia sp. S16]KAJ2096777.1 hypothetical protein GGI09_004181 [Coemansia sp. S100]KAJ2106612.1 hypothetical protein GGI16_001860 [Coemansia sp. S142-1]KAJ2463160.1 hypothetical protein GGI03_004014 [Coemansia sp. RSA 2337]
MESSVAQRRTATSARQSQQAANEATAASRPSSVASAPSTLAESLRSYWESRRSPRAAASQMLRSLYRTPRGQARTGIGRRAYVTTSAKVNQAVSRLVSLIMRDFVQEWYEKVTDDREFLGEVSSQIMLVVNEIEKRCRQVDWVEFILFELPDIVHLHIKDSHQCMARLGTVYVGRETSIEAIFQSMQPHVALAMAADSELAYLRRLSSELLQVFMPPEAQNDEVVHHLMREILACAVLRNVVDAVADPNTLNEGIIRAVGKYSKREYFSAADMTRYITIPVSIDGEADQAGDSGKEGVEEPVSPAQSHGMPPPSVETMLREAQTSRIGASGDAARKRSSSSGNASLARMRATAAAGGKERTVATDSNAPKRVSVDSRRAPRVNSPLMNRMSTSSLGDDSSRLTSAVSAVGGSSTAIAEGGQGSVLERLSSQLSFGSRWLISDLFSQARWRGWKNNTIRGLVYLHLIIIQAFSRIFSVFSEYTFSLNQLWQPDTIQASYRGAIEPILALVNALLLLDRYNHWAWVQFLFYIFPLINILAGAAIDRTLVKVVDFLLSEQQVESYVDLLIENLWKPENGGKFKSKDRPYKTLEQETMLRDDAAELVAELLPYVATKFFYGPSESERLLAAQRILEPFENRQLNKHLVYNILDAVVGKIAPELKEIKS